MVKSCDNMVKCYIMKGHVWVEVFRIGGFFDRSLKSFCIFEKATTNSLVNYWDYNRLRLEQALTILMLQI